MIESKEAAEHTLEQERNQALEKYSVLQTLLAALACREGKQLIIKRQEIEALESTHYSLAVEWNEQLCRIRVVDAPTQH